MKKLYEMEKWLNYEETEGIVVNGVGHALAYKFHAFIVPSVQAFTLVVLVNFSKTFVDKHP